MAAFTLGWRLAELYNRGSLPPPPRKSEEEKLPEHLPGASEMSDHDHATILVRQAHAALSIVTAAIGDLPAVETIQDALDQPGHHREDVQRKILEAYHSIYSALLGADPRLAESYGLGRLLADTAGLPGIGQVNVFAQRFNHYRLGNARHWLDDLTASFNPHAAAAVTASLDAWEAWINSKRRKDGTIDPAPLNENAVRSLRSQGELWRRLLSGEQDPMQLLGPQDYVEAGERLLQRGLQITAHYLRNWWPAITALCIATGTAIWVALTYAPAGTDRVTAVIVSAAAALGVSWKGIGATLGKTLSQAETALWASEVKVAAEKAATILPLGKPANARITPQPRNAAPARPSGSDGSQETHPNATRATTIAPTASTPASSALTPADNQQG
jgi:hypothetical protein